MKVMILAAGRGERLRPLTDTMPKPLIPVAGKALIEYHTERLQQSGFKELVINLGYRGEQIEAALGDGSRYGVSIQYSYEPSTALETGGGIMQALPLLDDGPFLLVNSDIWTDYPWQRLKNFKPEGLAHLILVETPDYRDRGDFFLQGGKVFSKGPSLLTYSGISVLRPKLFADCLPGRFSLTPLLRTASTAGQVGGEYYKGEWRDIGTPERLQELEQLFTTD